MLVPYLEAGFMAVRVGMETTEPKDGCTWAVRDKKDCSPFPLPCGEGGLRGGHCGGGGEGRGGGGGGTSVSTSLW